MKPYKIHRLTIRNVLGISEFSADIGGRSTTLEGANARGKSSALRAIGTALGLEKISLARLSPVKDGAPALDPNGEPLVPEVVLLLKGDGPDMRIRAAGDTRIVEEQEGAAWRRSKRPVGGLLSRLVDPLANPVAFLSAKPDQQIAWLLEALPCEGYSRQALLDAAQDAVGTAALPPLKPIPSGLHPLDDIEAVFDQVFSYRTDVGREGQLAKSTAERILSSLPADEPENPSDVLLRQRQALDVLRAQVATAEANVKSEYSKAVADAQVQHDAEQERIKAAHLAEIHVVEDELERAAAELRKECEKRVDRLRAEADVKIDAADSRAEDARTAAGLTLRKAQLTIQTDLNMAQDAVSEQAKEREALAREVASLDAKATFAATDHRMRQEARKAEAEADTLAARYSGLTRALDAIKAFRARLAGEIPIAGLEIRLGEKREVLVDGVPWGTVNTSRRASVALELAMLRSTAADDEPRLMVALMDDAEHFDSDSRAALVEAAEKAGVQLILAEVGSGPLGAA